MKTHVLNIIILLTLILGIPSTTHAAARPNSPDALQGSSAPQGMPPSSQVMLQHRASSATGEQNLDLVGIIGGYANAVAVQGNYAYTGFGRELTTIDITNPISPTHIGTTSLPNIIREIVLINDYLYVTSSAVLNNGYVDEAHGNLNIFDLLNPGTPVEVGHIETPGNATDLAVAGNYAYVADGNGGLRVIDISTPANPLEVGSYDDSVWPHDIAVAGNYAFVISDYCDRICTSKFEVIDISNPVSPTRVTSLSYDNTIGDVYVSGDYAYTVGSEMSIVDISDPHNPAKIHSHFMDVYGASIFVDEGYAYIAGEHYFEITNVSEPANVTEVGFVETSANSNAITTTGDYAYIIGEGGLQVITISDLANPSEVSLYRACGSTIDFAIVDNYAYITAYKEGLHIVDISDPTQPVDVGSYAIDIEGSPTLIASINIVDNYAYVGTDDGLWILDISDPVQPTQVSKIEAPSPIAYAVDIVVRGDYAYMLTDAGYGNSGLLIVDVSNPAAPVEAGSCQILDFFSPEKVVVAGNYAYLANSADIGFHVIDISDPANPTEVGQFVAQQMQTVSMDVAGDYAYLINRGYTEEYDDRNYLQIVDIADPANPTSVNVYDLQANYYNFDIDITIPPGSKCAYIGDEYTVRVVDISNPADPAQIAFYEIPGVDIVVGEEFIYVTALDRGFAILKLESTISGKVTDSYGAPIPNIAISAGANYSATTDTAGSYEIDGLPGGTYTLTPTLSGYTFWPPTHNATLPPSAYAQNFTLLAGPVSTTLEPSGTMEMPVSLTYTDTRDLPTTLSFPPGAVDQPTLVVLTPTLATGIPGWIFTGHAFDLSAYRDGAALPDLVFDTPVTATIRYSDTTVITDAAGLLLFWWDGSTWADATTACPMTLFTRAHDLDANILTTPICRTGRYALMGPTFQVYLPLIIRSIR